MVYVPAINVAGCEERFTLAGQKVEITNYFLNPAPWKTTTLQQWADDLDSWVSTSVLPLLSNQLAYRECYVVDLTTNTSPTATGIGHAGDTGGVEFNSVANSLAPCFSFVSAGRGRSSRGRNYWPGWPVNKIDVNIITSAWANLALDAYSELFGKAELRGYKWVILSRYSGVEIVGGKKKPIPREIGVTFEVTHAKVTDLVIDNQRRRKPGNGE